MEYIDGVRDSEEQIRSAKADAERREKMQAEARQRIELSRGINRGGNKDDDEFDDDDSQTIK